MAASTSQVQPPLQRLQPTFELLHTSAQSRFLGLQFVDTRHEGRAVPEPGEPQAPTFARLGPPSAPERKRVVAQLDPLLPVSGTCDDRLDAELTRVLAYLQASSVATKTVALMARARPKDAQRLAGFVARNDFYGATVADMVKKAPQRQRMQLASNLRGVKAGWTMALRQRYFALINDAVASSRGGNVYLAGWLGIRDEAAATLSPAEREHLAGVLGADETPPVELPAAKGPGRAWTVNAVLEPLDGKPELRQGRDLENGKRMFAAAACLLCHRFGLEGGAVGPDLTGLGGRFGLRDVLDAVVNPSAVISDQYQSMTATKKDGALVTGRLISQDDRQIVLMTNMYAPQDLTVLERKDVTSLEASPLSPMPAHLLDNLNLDEVLDLLAYLMGGKLR